jgi:protein-S-isoprenylcysteine O-methyltransferase Ste14
MDDLPLKKLFGVGPMGAGITLTLMAVAIPINDGLSHPQILRCGWLMRVLGVLLICTGPILLFSSIYTLRNWWAKNRLCTTGPFRWFRHPIYAAWITFVCPGIALYCNSLILLAWVLSVHLVWHRLVVREERTMVDHFQDEYRRYAERTGRFLPRLWSFWRS